MNQMPSRFYCCLLLLVALLSACSVGDGDDLEQSEGAYSGASSPVVFVGHWRTTPTGVTGADGQSVSYIGDDTAVEARLSDAQLTLSAFPWQAFLARVAPLLPGRELGSGTGAGPVSAAPPGSYVLGSLLMGYTSDNSQQLFHLQALAYSFACQVEGVQRRVRIEFRESAQMAVNAYSATLVLWLEVARLYVDDVLVATPAEREWSLSFLGERRS